MISCSCSNTDLALLVKDALVPCTEFPGEIQISIYQCNRCGALIAEDTDPEHQKED